MQLSIIIVSFNTKELTLGAIRSVIGQIGDDAEVIVVDNASCDGSAEHIADKFPSVNLLRLKANIGFGRANNLAAQIARGRLLLLLNPDTIVLQGSIDALLDFSRRRPQARIWGGRTLHADGTLNLRSCAHRPTLWSVFCASVGLAHCFPSSAVFNSEQMPDWPRDDERSVDIVVGCFFLIGRGDWVQLGGFDPAYFMYGEEVDLCLRARSLGVRPAICPNATVIHFEGASQPAAPRMAQILAGRIRYCQFHLPAFQRSLAVWMIRFGVLLRLTGYCIVPWQTEGRSRLLEVFRHRNIWWDGYSEVL